MRRGQQTRERLMDIAEAGVLSKGFGATSIEEIIAEAEITKSGFFYHFRDKNELARALLQRYIERDAELVDGLFDRARELHDDPLHSLIIGMKLFAELMADLPNGHPGCLVATFCYTEQLFDREIRELNRLAVLAWRKRFRDALDEVTAKYPPRQEVDLDDLADMFSAIVEGGIVLSKALNEPRVLPQQVMLLRSYLRMLFAPAVP